jgi:hypothetical protein
MQPFPSTSTDLEIFTLLDRRMKARTLTRGEWLAYSRWLRLRQRARRGNHRRRELEQARRTLVLIIGCAVARAEMRRLIRPIADLGAAFSAAAPAARRFAEIMKPYAPIGRHVMYEMEAGLRLERHFELGGGQ